MLTSIYTGNDCQTLFNVHVMPDNGKLKTKIAVFLPKHFPSLFCAQGLDVDSALLQNNSISYKILNNLAQINFFHLALSINSNV